MIERYEVEAFLALADELHFGRTAERLHLSTARVSQSIRKLERQVGVPLFTRTSRRVELTPIGRQLLADLEPAWQAVGAAVQRAVDAGRGISGTLRVAFVGAAAGQLLVGAVQAFRDRAPDCEVRIREAQAAELVRWLHEDVVDLGLGALPVDEPGLTRGPVLVSELRMLAVPAGRPAAEFSAMPVLPLDGTLHEALTLVGMGRGVLPVGAHVRRYYARPDVAYVPLADAPPVEWALCWPTDRATAAVRAFGEAAASIVAGA